MGIHGGKMNNASNTYSSLCEELKAYCTSGIAAMHMPGHKRVLKPVEGLPYDWDVTEVEGTDDLHHANGILKKAMDRTRDLVGSRRTWYLVNGSTCGNLTAIYAAVPRGSEVIVARNCHKSIFHAIEILDLKVHWLEPEMIPEFDVMGAVRKETVEELLDRYPASAAVVMTSPTYEGIVSDIAGIAKAVHHAGKVLLVDEAHGAHLGLFCHHRTRNEVQYKAQKNAHIDREDFSNHEGKMTDEPDCLFPDSAVHLGADVVVQSAHKTLPSLTQTALLHLCSERVSEAALEQGLDIFESSSPSYPLMVSLDGCTGFLMDRGEEFFREWEREIRRTFTRASDWTELEILGEPGAELPRIDTMDYSKLLIRSAHGIWNGPELGDFLRREGIEPEMCCGQNVLLMTSCADTAEIWNRLWTALEHLNQALGEDRAVQKASQGKKNQLSAKRMQSKTAEDQNLHEGTALEKMSVGMPALEPSDLSLSAAAQKALHEGWEEVLLSEAENRIAAEYVMAYPPGIPILVPGARITSDTINYLQGLEETGTELRFSLSQKPNSIGCLCSLLNP